MDFMDPGFGDGVWGGFDQGTDSWILDLSPRKQGRKTKNLIFETISTIRRSDAGVAIDRRVYPILLSLWSYVAGYSNIKIHIPSCRFSIAVMPVEKLPPKPRPMQNAFDIHRNAATTGAARPRAPNQIRRRPAPPQSKWPWCHKLTLGRAMKLGERKLDSFAMEPNVTSDEPWKVQVMSQAALLVAKSRRCKQRNESSWRFACEPFIFARW